MGQQEEEVHYLLYWGGSVQKTKKRSRTAHYAKRTTADVRIMEEKTTQTD